MRVVIKILFLLPFLAILVGYLRKDLLLGTQDFSVDMRWTLFGAVLSYYGVLFSAFAVLEVRELSTRYFNRQRLPEIKKQLDKIIKVMAEVGEKSFADLRTERFVGEIAVMIRQIQKTKVSGFTPVTKRAASCYAVVDRKLKEGLNNSKLANDSEEFWNLFRALTELSDEITEYNKEAQAIL
jgi:hypothetical protein